MSSEVAREYWDDWGLVLLWMSVLLGPLAVSFDLGAGYALVKPLCAGARPDLLRLVSAAALALTAIGTIIGSVCWSRLRQTAIDDGGRVIDRSYFMSIVAIGLNVLSAILIATAGGARFLMSCE